MADDLPPALRGSTTPSPQGSRPTSQTGNNQPQLTPEQIREQAMREVAQGKSDAFSGSRPVINTGQSPQSGGNASRSAGLSYLIKGNDIQFVEITLNPNDSVIGEYANMMYYENGIEIKSRVNSDASTPKGIMGKMMDAGKAAVMGEKVFITIFTNATSQQRKIAFSAPHTAKVVALDVQKLGGSVLCQKDAFLCGSQGIRIGRAKRDETGAGVFDSGTQMDRLEGSGVVFICLGGEVSQRNLASGETLYVNKDVTAARQASVGYKVKKAINNGLSGEKYRVTETLTGPGAVWLQSLPLSKTRDSIVKHVMTFVSAMLKKNK